MILTSRPPTVRNRLLTALLAAALLTTIAATPIASGLIGFDSAAYAGECSNSSC